MRTLILLAFLIGSLYAQQVNLWTCDPMHCNDCSQCDGAAPINLWQGLPMAVCPSGSFCFTAVLDVEWCPVVKKCSSCANTFASSCSDCVAVDVDLNLTFCGPHFCWTLILDINAEVSTNHSDGGSVPNNTGNGTDECGNPTNTSTDNNSSTNTTTNNTGGDNSTTNTTDNNTSTNTTDNNTSTNTTTNNTDTNTTDNNTSTNTTDNSTSTNTTDNSTNTNTTTNNTDNSTICPDGTQDCFDLGTGSGSGSGTGTGTGSGSGTGSGTGGSVTVNTTGGSITFPVLSGMLLKTCVATGLAVITAGMVL